MNMDKLKKESQYTTFDSEAEAFERFCQQCDLFNSPNLENLIKNLDSQSYQDLCGRIESLRNSLVKLEPFLGPDENEPQIQNTLYLRCQDTNDDVKKLSNCLSISNQHLYAKMPRRNK